MGGASAGLPPLSTWADAADPGADDGLRRPEQAGRAAGPSRPARRRVRRGLVSPPVAAADRTLARAPARYGHVGLPRRRGPAGRAARGAGPVRVRSGAKDLLGR